MPEEEKEVMAKVTLRFSRTELCVLLAKAEGRMISADDPLSLEWDDEAQELTFSFFETLTESPTQEEVPLGKGQGVRSEVLIVLGTEGPLTDLEIANRSPNRYSVGAIRRARKYLVDTGYVECVGKDESGERRGGPQLWGLVPRGGSPVACGSLPGDG
jgi:hypothetical protein